LVLVGREGGLAAAFFFGEPEWLSGGIFRGELGQGWEMTGAGVYHCGSRR
jgi:hypothetical protein